MVRKNKEREVQHIENMRGGQGVTALTSILTGEEEMYHKGRLFKQISIPVGGSIGYHVHENESETFYFIQGSGELDDNGATLTFETGDVLYTPAGHGHSVKNTGDVPVEMIALILFE